MSVETGQVTGAETLLACIREMLGSSPSRDTNYPEVYPPRDWPCRWTEPCGHLTVPRCRDPAHGGAMLLRIVQDFTEARRP